MNAVKVSSRLVHDTLMHNLNKWKFIFCCNQVNALFNITDHLYNSLDKVVFV